MKSLLRRWFPNFASIPEYVVVGLAGPQKLIIVELHGLGNPLDVTLNHTLASMRPVIISIGFDSGQDTTALEDSHLSLVFLENAPGRKVLGEIFLQFSRSIPLPQACLALFTTTGHRNVCIPWAALQFYYARRALAGHFDKIPFNFRITTSELHGVYVFYICPRPVVLVSVVHGDASNIFPMDLIGPVRSGYFLMALRSTSPAVRLMEQSRQMALSDIPDSFKEIAYYLGKHHRKESIDWNALPFETAHSHEFRLPVPCAALRIREVKVEEVHVVGSHTLFVTTILHEGSMSDSAQMFHIHGLYNQYMTNLSKPLDVSCFGS